MNTFSKLLFVLFAFAVLTPLLSYAQNEEAKIDEQIFIPAKDKGIFGREIDIKLEVTVSKPKGNGPFPLVILNHGSTGNGTVPATITFKWPWQTKFYLERGFVVLAPMRRGRGASEGNTDVSEPWTMCDQAIGLENAMQDLDSVIAYARTLPYIDMTKVVISGASRGGILSLLYASKRPDLAINGVVNFVGGWSNHRGCPGNNEKVFQDAGSGHKVPTLWIYGEGDLNYSDDAIRSYHQLFQAGNPNVVFRMYSGVPGGDGHRVVQYSRFWAVELRDFLSRIGFPRTQ